MTEYNDDIRKVWAETYTGKKVHPFNLNPDDIDAVDIAHALSMKCRFGGHTKVFYSIAEHCLLTAKLAAPELKGFALLHDAAEYILPDLIRPIKNHVPFLVKAEQDIIVKIYEKFFGRAPNTDERKEIKKLDNIMLLREATILMDNIDDWENFGITDIGRCDDIIGLGPILAEKFFLDEFYKLGVLDASIRVR